MIIDAQKLGFLACSTVVAFEQPFDPAFVSSVMDPFAPMNHRTILGSMRSVGHGN